MAPQKSLFPPDRQDQRPVHFESPDGRASDGRQAPDVDFLPPEVVGPRISSWVEQPNLLATLGIDRRLPGAFAKRAGDARQCQIAGGGRSV